MRMRRKSNLETRVERCAHLLVSQPEELRGRWLDGTGCDELFLELGCGRGRFTVETAKSRHDVFFVALEKTTNVIVIALERAALDGLSNIRFVNRFADHLADFFAPGEVSRIYLNFCDPWPSRRHVKRRMTGQRFLEIYGHVLRPGGEIHFKTDNKPLFEYSLGEFERCGFVVSEATRDLHGHGTVGVMTDYEMKFYEQGIPICQCIAKKAECGA